MKQLLTLVVIVVIFASCSIERRHHLPGYHVEWRKASGECRVANDEWSAVSEKSIEESTAISQPTSSGYIESENLVVASASNEIAFAPCSKSETKPLATRHSPLAIRHSPLLLDTLKKPFKPQQQYREVDPVGKWSVFAMLAAVGVQKVAGLLTWFQVIVPLSFASGVFIPAFILAIIGLVLICISAYRVRKNPEKYKKNEWGKAALAILGWQILMSVLFAWLLGGLPIGG
jgi:hypothetical protein